MGKFITDLQEYYVFLVDGTWAKYIYLLPSGSEQNQVLLVVNIPIEYFVHGG